MWGVRLTRSWLRMLHHQAEPGRNSRRHDAAPDSRPGSFFILAFPSRRQAEPAPISRRHDAAPDSRQAEPAPNSRIGFVRGPTVCPAVLGLCKNFVSLVQAGRLSLHPFRERTSCGSKLNALAQVACLWLRSFVQIEVFVSLFCVLVWCGAQLPASRCRVCACRGEGAPPRAPGVFAGLAAPAGSPSTHQWACPAHTLWFLSFHDERNQRRAGAAPLDPLRGARCPPCGVAAPPQ